MKFVLLLLVALSATATPLLTPKQQLEAVASEVGFDLSHITVLKVPLNEYLRGAACSPTLIVTNANLWDIEGNAKNFVHIMHEVGHVLGLLHNNGIMRVRYQDEPLDINRTAMSTPSPEPLRALIFRNHYIQEMKYRLTTQANASRFWYSKDFPVKPLDKDTCLNVLASPDRWGDILIDWR